MVRKMSKKTLLWTSAVSLVLCVALVIGIIAMAIVGGGTNRITTANMDLELWKHNGTEYVDISDGEGDIFAGGKNGVVWEPGKIELAFLQVKNTGSSDVSFNVTQDVQLSNAEGAPSGLSYAVLQDMSYDDYSATNMETWKSIQKKAAAQGNIVLGSTTTASDVVLAAGESSYFVLAVHMDDKAEAAYEGITIDLKLSGKQLGGEIEEQTVFYVSPTGHDGNPGTEAEPIKTFRRAAQLAKPGQTFIFEDGTYNESAMTIIMNSGTEEAPIVFKARNEGKAKIMYPESLCGTDCMQIKGKEYITIEGFEITQAVMADDSHERANMDILVRVASCNNITFRNNTMHGALEEPLKVAGCSGLLIEGNHIYNSGNEGIDFVNVRDSIIRNNTVEDCGRIALMCKGGSRSNLFYGNYIVNKTVQGQWAMQLGGATDNVSTWGCSTEDWEAFNCYAFNNVIVAEIEGGFQTGLSFMGSKDCGFFNNVVIGAVYGLESQTANNEVVQWEWSPTVNNPQFKNNIIMNSLKSAYNIIDEPVNPDFSNNLFYGNAGTDPQETGSIYGQDPMFVADKSDWHLKAGSPAIGAGAAIGEQKGLSGQFFFIGFDRDYILRGDTWDIGAYDADGTETYEPGGIVYQDPAWLVEIDHTIYEAPEVGSMPEAGTVLVDENFDETTSLDAWIECARSKGQWEIKNGLMSMKTTELEGHAIIGVKDGLEWSDYEFSAKVMAPSKNGTSSGIVFRADEGLENMYGFRFHPESGGEQLEFCVWNNDKFSSIKYFKFNWTNNKIYELKVIAVGNDFEFYVDGEKIGTASDGSHSVGTAALYSYLESRVFDNVSVKSARGYQVVHIEEEDDTPEYTGRVLYEEDFSSSDAMANWKQYTGEWKIDGGIMTGTTGIEGENIIIYEGGYDWVNYEFTCDVRQPEKGGMWAGLIFRCNDNKTGYYGFRFVNDNTQVVKGWPGSWTQMGTKAMSSLPKGEVAELKVVVIDDTFRCYLNGKMVWEDDDKMYKKGSIGLFQQNMTDIIFDNIVVKEIVSEGVSVEEEEVDTTPTGTVVYNENFSDASTSEKWVDLVTENGAFAYADGQLKYTQISDKDGSTTYLKDGYWKNMTVVLNATLPSTYEGNSWFKVGFRSNEASDGTYVYLMNLTNSDRLRIVNTASNEVLKEVPGGAITAYHDGKEHEIKIKVNETTVEVLIDDYSVVEYTSDKISTDPGSIYLSAYNFAYTVNDVKVYCDDNPILTKPEAGTETDTYVPDGTLVLDDALDADSTKWQGLTSENGTYTFQDGKLVYTHTEGAKNGSTLLYKDGYWTNFTLTFDATFPRSDLTTGWMRVGLRTTDGSDKPFVYFQNLARDYLNVNDGIEKINSVYGGEVSKFYDGKEHKVRISVVNNTIDVYIDGELKLSTTDELIEAVPGTISFACYGSGYTIDNVKVYTTDNPILTKPAGDGTGTGDGTGSGTQDDTTVPTYNEADVILKEDFSSALGSNWQTKGNGTVKVDSGALTIDQAAEIDGNTIVWYNSETSDRWADYNIYVKMSTPDGSGKWSGIIFRSDDDADPYYHLRFLNGLVQFGTNTKSDIKHASSGLAKDGQVHDVCISVKGSTVKVYIDGTLMLTAEDTAIKGGTVGFAVQDAATTIDDLVVVKTGEFLPEGTTDPTDPAEPTAPSGFDPSTDVISGTEVLSGDFASNLLANWEITQSGGGYTYNEGKLQYGTVTNKLYYKNGSWTNFTVTFKATMPNTAASTSWLRVQLRTTNGGDGAYVYFQNLGTDYIKIVNAANTTLQEIKGSAAAKVFDGKEHYFKIVVADTTVSLYIDGAEALTATDASIAATPGSVGFISYNHGYTFTDLKVYNQDAPSGTEPTEPGATEQPTTPPATEPEDVLYQNDFSSALESGWQTNGKGSAAVADGVLTIDPADGINQTWYTSNTSSLWKDYEVSVKVTVPDANGKWSAIMFRSADDASNYYYVQFINGIIQVRNQAGTTFETARFDKDGAEHNVKISVIGDTIKVYYDDVLKITTTDTAIVAGTVGFRAQNMVATFDDLKVVNKGAAIVPPVEPPTSEPATSAPSEPATTAPSEPATTAPTEPATTAPTEPEDILYQNDFSSALESGWQNADLSNVTVEDGKLKIGYSDEISRVWYTSETTNQWKDYDVYAKLSVPDANGKWSELLLRTADDLDDYYRIMFFNNRIYLRNKAGDYLANTSFTADGLEHDLKVSVRTGENGESTITVYYDNSETPKITYTCSGIAAGGVGFGVQHMAATFDDLKVVNKGEPVVAKTYVDVTAQFNDNNNVLGSRITEFNVTLTGNSTDYPATLKADDNWAYTFEVPKYDGEGNEITYTLGVPTVTGYRTAVTNGNTVTLDPLTSFAGTVVWNHDDNPEANRPASVTITLMRGSAPVETKTVLDGAFTFENLDQFYNGSEAVYTVMVATDDVPTGYRVNVSGGTVNVTYIPEAIDIDVEITFDDGDDLDGIRPAESVKITVTGMKGTEPYSEATYEITKAADWKNTLSLRKSHGGTNITYSVSVAAADLPTGYTAEVTGYTVTLKHVPETMVVLNESFTESNAIDNWTTLTPASGTTGSYAVTDGKLTFTHGSGTGGVGIVSNQAGDIEDLELSFKMQMPENRTWVNVLLRNNGTSTGNGIRVNFYNFGSGSNRKIRIYNGNTLLKDVNSFASSYYSGEQEVKISLIGNNIKVSIGGTELVNLTDDNLVIEGGGTVAFHTYGYNATFDDVKLIDKTEYTVTWDVEGSTTEETYMAGKTPAYPDEDPTKPEDEDYTYTFDGWDADGDDVVDTIQRVTKDVTYKAHFIATAK